MRFVSKKQNTCIGKKRCTQFCTFLWVYYIPLLVCFSGVLPLLLPPMFFLCFAHNYSQLCLLMNALLFAKIIVTCKLVFWQLTVVLVLLFGKKKVNLHILLGGTLGNPAIKGGSQSFHFHSECRRWSGKSRWTSESRQKAISDSRSRVLAVGGGNANRWAAQAPWGTDPAFATIRGIGKNQWLAGES